MYPYDKYSYLGDNLFVTSHLIRVVLHEFYYIKRVLWDQEALRNSFVLVRILLGVGAEGSLIVCGLRSSTSGTS